MDADVYVENLLSDLDTDSLGELEDMAEIDKRIYLKATSGRYYTVQSDSILTPVQVLPAQLQEKWRNQSSVSMNRAFSTRRRNNLDKLCPWINNG